MARAPVLVLIAVSVLYGCKVDAPAPPTTDDDSGADIRSPTPPSVQLVDSTISPAVAGADGWHYQQSADVDLTGDGNLERVVPTARVELYRGRPAWDDSQPWQVYVESQDGTRTYIYAQRLQLGTLTMRVSRGDSDPVTIVLLEHLPDRLRVFEAQYMGPGAASVEVRFQRDLDPRGEIASPRLP
jgi:hypothetical protein